MTIKSAFIEGVFIIYPDIHEDDRGFFYEFYNNKEFIDKTGLQINFIQDNIALSQKGTLRGLHFQTGKFAQAKLVSVIKGAVLDVVVDLRKNSKTFGQHFSIELTEKNKVQLFIPRGFAHGYYCKEDNTLFFYKIDNVYNKKSERGLLFNDYKLNIDWQIDDLKNIILSDKDKNQPLLKDIINEL